VLRSIASNGSRPPDPVTLSATARRAAPAVAPTSLDRGERVAVDPLARLAWVVVEDPPAVVQVNLATGARSILSDATHGAGRQLVEPRAIAFDAARRRLLVGDDDDDSLWSVSLKNGARTLLSVEPVVAGNDLHRTSEIVPDATHAALLVQSDDRSSPSTATGARSEFSFEDPVASRRRMDGGAPISRTTASVHDQAPGFRALSDGARTPLSARGREQRPDGGSGRRSTPNKCFPLTLRALLPLPVSLDRRHGRRPT
jgi:hypothetical protein